jgi:hypothetical protein
VDVATEMGAEIGTEATIPDAVVTGMKAELAGKTTIIN